MNKKTATTTGAILCLLTIGVVLQAQSAVAILQGQTPQGEEGNWLQEYTPGCSDPGWEACKTACEKLDKTAIDCSTDTTTGATKCKCARVVFGDPIGSLCNGIPYCGVA